MTTGNKVGINVGVKDQATEKLKKIGVASKNMGNSFAGAYKHTQKMNKSLQSLTKDANRANASLTSFGKGMNMTIGTAKVVALANAFSRMTQLAMDAVETLNLFNVSLGENAEASEKFVANMNEAFGFDTTNIRSAVGTYALLAKSMGMSGDQAQRLAENSTKLAYDLSSLMNVPIEQVMGDLRSGLVGQSETMYKYGVDVTEASLKTEALAQGISKSVRNMSQGEKMALRYSVMLKQTALAHGDFANTINSPANQLKILGERMITLGRTIGFTFMQMIAPVLPYLNAITAALIEMLMVVATLFGYDPKFSGATGGLKSVTDDADSASEAVDGVTDSMKKLKNFNLGMDELNVIDTTAGSGGAGAEGGGTSILPEMDLSWYDNLMKKVDDTAKKLKDDIKPILESILVTATLIGIAFLAWKLPTWLMAGGVATGLANIIKIAGGVALVFLGVYLALESVKGILDGSDITWTELGKILGGILLVAGGLALIFKSPIFAAITLVIGGLFLIFEGLQRVLEKAKPTWQDFATVLAGVALVLAGLAIICTVLGIGISAVAFVVVALIAVVALLTLAIYKYHDEIKAFLLKWFTIIGDKISSFMDGVKEKVSSTIENVKNILATIGKFFYDYVITPLINYFTYMSNIYKGIANVIITIFEKMINYVIGAINSAIAIVNMLIEGINEVLIVDISWRMDKVPDVNLPRLAQGGSLEAGQLFQAGEFGKAELVGSHQGKTTVMPLENTDFVQAMYSAVKDAMSSVDLSGQVVETVVNLDGDVIYTNQQKVARKRGTNLGMGVFSR